MDIDYWINEVVRMYFSGYELLKAIGEIKEKINFKEID